MTHPETFDDDDDLTDAERWRLIELSTLDEILDREREALEAIEAGDTMGFHWFADRNEWLEPRLRRYRNRR
ncbi:hypothetical protein [Mycobacterium attenuatum]|uniref:hypothetical protein n=1 Tax=Mycobacterium attenuatum TaxID=2341086 RepID=UPI000F011ACE|nr:hypothetical protein [Mycobacterium attenuatum]VBA60285.1 hypothetical protein LAUMK41_03922 [Mycobacterium attenuatum]